MARESRPRGADLSKQNYRPALTSQHRQRSSGLWPDKAPRSF
ncbi:hypothetical protein OH686_13650 [Pseudomonas sp. SO81]|nr:hypothetical protein OH686_13650 [Pseudomonas sp. SO81]